MHIIYNHEHHLHAPEYEFYRGQKVPCFENPQRADIAIEALRNAGYQLHLPELDSTQVLPQVHSEAYLEFLQGAWQQWCQLDKDNHLQQAFPSVWPVRSLRSDVLPDNFVARLGLYSMDNGTPMSAGTWQAARQGADAVVSAAKLLGDGERVVLCATRPPGHHAGVDFMGGYCFLNNAAVAAQALLNNGCTRVAVLDVDFHHGNGTQSIFYGRSDVMFVSIHGDPRTEFPFYLGHADETGEGVGDGYNINFPLAAGSSSAQWFAAFSRGRQQISAYQPDALVVSLGLDTYAGDPISNFNLQAGDFEQLGREIAALNLPTIMVLEGGYATAELGNNIVRVLQGFD